MILNFTQACFKTCVVFNDAVLYDGAFSVSFSETLQKGRKITEKEESYFSYIFNYLN